MTTKTTAAGSDTVPGWPNRPVRFEDPARNAAYWARIAAIVDEAPPLSEEQRAAIRVAIWGSRRARTEAA